MIWKRYSYEKRRIDSDEGSWHWWCGHWSSSVVAQCCKELGILTVAVVTMPFPFEGGQRQAVAKQGLKTLTSVVDIIVVVQNKNIMKLAERQTSLTDAFLLVHLGFWGIRIYPC